MFNKIKSLILLWRKRNLRDEEYKDLLHGALQKRQAAIEDIIFKSSPLACLIREKLNRD